MTQGQIWWADLPEPAGRRPVVILTRTPGLRRLTNVTVAPITRTARGIETEVPLTPADGVPTDCIISLDNIATVRKQTLDNRIATLSTPRMNEVFIAIRAAFAMP